MKQPIGGAGHGEQNGRQHASGERASTTRARGRCVRKRVCSMNRPNCRSRLHHKETRLNRTWSDWIRCVSAGASRIARVACARVRRGGLLCALTRQTTDPVQPATPSAG
eukprot:6208288-Pleurochrysis_carterae.AAC.3